MQNFRVVLNGSYPVDTVFQSEKTSAGIITPTGKMWENIDVNGAYTVGKVWRFALGSGGDGNDDLNTFINCKARYYTVAGWSFEHSQTVANYFVNSAADGNNVGLYGLTTALATSTALGQGGSFNWSGGAMNGNTVADFYLGDPSGSPMSIRNVHSEGSARFVQMTSSPDITDHPFTIEGNEVEVDDNAPPDTYDIVLMGSGPFVVTNNRLNSSHNVRISLNSNYPSKLSVENNDFDFLQCKYPQFNCRYLRYWSERRHHNPSPKP